MKTIEPKSKPIIKSAHLPAKHTAVNRGLLKSIWKFRAIYAMLLPGIIWYIIFAYFPMGGLSLAFKQYKANLGILGSPWNGFENYIYVFRDARFFRSIVTTLTINLGRMLISFPFPIILAISLNEIRVGRYKKILQTIYTFPHFLSWILVASIMINFLAIDGFVNNLLKTLGRTEIAFLGDPNKFRPMVYITEVWKGAGWSAIIYLAAISGIDTEQYEAAEIDGASRIQRILYITLPNIASTIMVLFILACGNLMTAGFDQIFNLSNPAVSRVSETLDMYIYNITFRGPADFGFSTAVSLLKSVINMLLLLSANKILIVLTGNGLFNLKEENQK